MKKALALILSLMMIMSVCSVSAASTLADSVPVNGVVFSDDFESYSVRTEAMAAYGGIWERFNYSLDTDVNGKKMFTNINTADVTGLSQMMFGSQKVFGTNAEVNVGTLTYDIDFYIPEADEITTFPLEDGEFSGLYLICYSNSGWNANIASIPMSVFYENDAPKFYFATKATATTAQHEAAMDIYDGVFGENNVEIAINFEEGTIQFSLNGEVKATRNAGKAETDKLALGYASFTNSISQFEYMYEEIPKVYIDAVSATMSYDAGTVDVYVPSSELEEPKVLLNEDFTDVTEFTADMWRDSNGTPTFVAGSTIADGVVNLTNQAYPCFRLPKTTATDVYELSYDVKGTGGRLVVYDYSVGSGTSSANMACYKPGSGVVAGVNAGDAVNIAVADDSKWYTIKVEWCAAESNRYMYYSVYDRETNEKLGYFERYGKWVTGEGKDVSNYMPLQSMMLWNDGMTSCQVDNIVVKQLPVGYGDYKVYQPQIWVDDVLATAETTVNVGSVIESQAYGPAGSVLVLAAYDANGELVATATSTAAIRDLYNFKVTATADDFAGAASLKLFFFAGLDAGFKPVTVCYNSATK